MGDSWLLAPPESLIDGHEALKHRCDSLAGSGGAASPLVRACQYPFGSMETGPSGGTDWSMAALNLGTTRRMSLSDRPSICSPASTCSGISFVSIKPRQLHGGRGRGPSLIQGALRNRAARLHSILKMGDGIPRRTVQKGPSRMEERRLSRRSTTPYRGSTNSFRVTHARQSSL